MNVTVHAMSAAQSRYDQQSPSYVDDPMADLVAQLSRNATFRAEACENAWAGGIGQKAVEYAIAGKSLADLIADACQDYAESSVRSAMRVWKTEDNAIQCIARRWS
jgi:hypothetical protein